MPSAWGTAGRNVRLVHSTPLAVAFARSRTWAIAFRPFPTLFLLGVAAVVWHLLRRHLRAKQHTGQLSKLPSGTPSPESDVRQGQRSLQGVSVQARLPASMGFRKRRTGLGCFCVARLRLCCCFRAVPDRLDGKTSLGKEERPNILTVRNCSLPRSSFPTPKTYQDSRERKSFPNGPLFFSHWCKSPGLCSQKLDFTVPRSFQRTWCLMCLKPSLQLCWPPVAAKL